MRESLLQKSDLGKISLIKKGDIGRYQVLFEEWGAKGPDKAELVREFVSCLKDVGVSWLYWEVVKPGQGESNYEVYVERLSGSVSGSEY
jgi:hypothetical protein